ncbi:MAG: cytochrome c peroxidase [Bacteroidota bacterium]
MKKTLLLISVIGLAILLACTGKQPDNKAAEKLKNDSIRKMAMTMFPMLPKQAVNPDNAMTTEKVALGKVLYFETRLSKKGNNSCNGCHNLNTYGVDNKPTSPGDEGALGGRNSPTSFNSALQFVQFWDGRAKDVEEQAGGPVLNPVEMNMPDKSFVEKKISSIKGYPEMFATAYPGEKKPVNYENMKKAIGAFERTLLTPGRYDEWLEGNDSAMNSEEIAGLQAFISTGCTACHMGSLFGGSMYQKFPLFGDQKTWLKTDKVDEGRFAVTKAEADKFMFKVPILRNVAETWPYFHSGSVKDLNEAIGIMAQSELNKTLKPEEISSISAFLKTLTGKLSDDVKKAPALPGA